jgi:hypothetical protein
LFVEFKLHVRQLLLVDPSQVLHVESHVMHVKAELFGSMEYDGGQDPTQLLFVEEYEMKYWFVDVVF